MGRLEWNSPSPWEGREGRAGRAFFFSSIHCEPCCRNGRMLRLPPRFVVPSQRPSLREGKKPISPSTLGQRLHWISPFPLESREERAGRAKRSRTEIH